MDGDDVRSLARVLLYGGVETRRALAMRLGSDERGDLWRLLVATVRSDEPWLLRARCLEVLGLVVANADPERAAIILSALIGPSSDGSGGSARRAVHGSVPIS